MSQQPENVNPDSSFQNAGYAAEEGEERRRKPRKRRDRDREEPAPATVEQVDPNEPSEQTVEKTTPKKERRRRRKDVDEPDNGVSNAVPVGIAAHLEDLQEDIEVIAAGDEMPPLSHIMSAGKSNQMMGQNTTGNVYVEGPSRFKQENQQKFLDNKLREQRRQQQMLSLGEQQDQDNQLLESSIGISDRFRVMSTFVVGLFSGLLIMHAIFVFVLPGNEPLSFVSRYFPMQRSFSIFTYIAFIVVSISVWDRVNVGAGAGRSSNPYLDRSCDASQASLLVALLLLFIGFVLHNALYSVYDSTFSDYNRNTSNAAFATTMTAAFTAWRILYAVVAALVAVAWLIVAVVPDYDAFASQMRSYLQPPPLSIDGDILHHNGAVNSIYR